MSTHPIPVLLYEIIQNLRARNPKQPALIGVAGAQGSGKSYACRLLALAHQPRIAHFSLDDVYLTKADRRRLATKFHPLFATRGPPGTHDLDLAYKTLSALEDGMEARIPRFDKRADDRAPCEDWPTFKGCPEAILLDGWCIGAKNVETSSDEAPLNAVESEQDADGEWRRYVEAALATDYASFFNAFDAIVYLQAPSWDIVRVWRGQQEEQTLGRPLTAEENASLDRFVMHYERITRSMMAGHHSANWVVRLDEARKVTRIEEM